MNRSRSSSLAHTEIDPPRELAGSDHSHMPTAPGMAYHPIRMFRPFNAMPGSSRRRCARNSVTLTTTGAPRESTGPGIQGIRSGLPDGVEVVLEVVALDSISSTLVLRLVRVRIQFQYI